MPGVYNAGPQMFNEIFNFPTGVELLGVPAVKEDGVASSKLSSNWRGVSISNNGGHQQQQYDYSYGSFGNAQKDGNLNMQGLDAMQLYPANGGEYSGPAISFNSNDRGHQSSEINSMQFQIPGFPQSMANQGICSVEQVPSSSVSWQSGAGLNELLLLPTGNNGHGNNLLNQNNNHNHQFAPPGQLNNSANWGNNSVHPPSSSQWSEQSQSPMEGKLGEGFRRRDDRSVQGLSLSLSSNSQVQVQPFDTNRLINPPHDLVNRIQSNSDVKNKSMDILNASKVGLFSRSEGILAGKGYWNPTSGSAGQFSGLLKHSKFMRPTQQLLDEFCNVAGKGAKGKSPKQNQNNLKPKPEVTI